jgi:hypothetical protein
LQRISFDSEGYNVADADVAAFAARVARIARSRGIRVEEEKASR